MNVFDVVGNITGIVAFVISAINFGYFFIIRRKKLNVRFDEMTVVPHFSKMECLKVRYIFENQSQLPISITRMQLLLDGNYIDCERLPYLAEEIKHSVGDKVKYHEIIKTNSVPFAISSLGAVSGFFAFAIPQGTLSKNEKALTFRICTNRGKAVQKTFVLREDTPIY